MGRNVGCRTFRNSWWEWILVLLFIRVRGADPMTSGFARNSYQTPYKNIYKDNHSTLLVVAGSQRHQECPSLGKKANKGGQMNTMEC